MILAVATSRTLTTGVPRRRDVPTGNRDVRCRADAVLRGTMEALVLAIVCLSPWAFGAVEPIHEFLLQVGLALLLVLWAARVVVGGGLCWAKCPVLLCVAGLFLLAVLQNVPLPSGLLQTLSPATARLHEQLLPAQPEVLANGSAEHGSLAATSGTLSLYPGGTRRELMRLLAVLLLFAVVRNNLATPGCLRRLAVAVLINGALLAIFAVLQRVSAPPKTVYWSYTASNPVFGPFLYKNHFPFYINICLGLGLGLLLASIRQQTAVRQVYAAGWGGPMHRLLGNVPALWIVSGLSLLLASSLMALSRGGFLALVGAAGMCVGLWLRRRPSAAQLGGLATPALLLVALVGALLLGLNFGLDPMTKRLATLEPETVVQESRLEVWLRVLPLAAQFPVWGTGYGTFRYVEPLCRTSGTGSRTVWESAHNDYLEALIEGGAVRLVLTLLALGLLCRAGIRAVSGHGNRMAGALAWGALFALLTLILHSSVDFGLHVPAIAVLVTVLAAQLSALGDTSTSGTVRLGGAKALLAGLAVVTLGLALCGASWEAHLCHTLRGAAGQLKGHADFASQQLRVGYLQEAAQRGPEIAAVHVELGQAYSDLCDVDRTRRQRRDRLQAGATLVLDGAAAPGLPTIASALLAAGLRSTLQEAAEAELAQAHLLPAMQSFLQARAACALLPEPHLALATHDALFSTAEPRHAYLRRVKMLAPADPQAWYTCGLHELPDRPEEAFASWRRCLELSDQFLAAILDCAEEEVPQEDFNQFLPDRPAILLAAALELYPERDEAAQRRPLLNRALRLLEQIPAPPSAEDLRTRARIVALLGRTEEAAEAYRQALSLRPTQLAWRYELAELLFRSGQARAARRELLLILDQQPGHTEAGSLLRAVAAEIAAKG